MTTDPDRDGRIAYGLRRVADALTVSPPDPDQLRARAALPPRTPRFAVWRWPVLAAVAVLIVMATIALLPGLGVRGRGPAPAGPVDAPTLPTRFAGMSLLTAPVSTAPPGPAVALYHQGSLGTRRGTTQVVVLGADGHTYRRLDLAEKRGAVGDDGEWSAAGALLAPDGSEVAVASADRLADHLELVDLRSGVARAIPLGRSAAVRLLAWAPDGTRLAIAMLDGPLDGSPVTGRLAVLDLRDGRVQPVGTEQLTDVMLQAAVSPDGTMLAVPVGTGRVDLVDFSGAVRRSLTLPEGYYLDSPSAWSPDGRLLAVQYLGAVRGGLAFVDTTGSGGPVPAPLSRPEHPSELLGWTSDTTVLVGVEGSDYEIVQRSVDGVTTRTVARLSQGVGRIARVSGLQLAGGLVPDLRITEVGEVDRGPWPRWWLTLVVAFVVVIGLLVHRAVRRRAVRSSTVSGSGRPTGPGPTGRTDRVDR
ncbi:hypothetical protein [Micromonospora sp. NPDC004704]